MKKFTDGRTDAAGHNIIRPFFKRAYKNCKKSATLNCYVYLKNEMYSRHPLYFRFLEVPKQSTGATPAKSPTSTRKI